MEKSVLNNDKTMVERCILGDLSAWDDLVRKYSPLVYAAIDNRARRYRSPLPRHEIQDIMQDVFSSIWIGAKLGSIRNRDNISCWLAVVAGNGAVGYLRKKDDREVQCDDQDKPAEVPRDEEMALEIEKAIEGMAPQESLIMQLNIIYDKKYREISDMLDIPIGTVASCVKRAKDRLRKKLKNYRKIFAIILSVLTSLQVGG
jgi:RNA polymerase sigma-70 factor (ECF subfamily)